MLGEPAPEKFLLPLDKDRRRIQCLAQRMDTWPRRIAVPLSGLLARFITTLIAVLSVFPALVEPIPCAHEQVAVSERKPAPTGIKVPLEGLNAELRACAAQVAREDECDARPCGV